MSLGFLSAPTQVTFPSRKRISGKKLKANKRKKESGVEKKENEESGQKEKKDEQMNQGIRKN